MPAKEQFATWDEKALERASFELQGHFGREGSIYGIKACEEIARIAIVAYDRSKSRPPRTTSTWLAAVFEDMCESLPDAVSARLHADIDAIHRILSTRSEIVPNDGMTEAAEIAGREWHAFSQTKQAHERNSPGPFHMKDFGFDWNVVSYSRDCESRILALKDAAPGRSLNGAGKVANSRATPHPVAASAPSAMGRNDIIEECAKHAESRHEYTYSSEIGAHIRGLKHE